MTGHTDFDPAACTLLTLVDQTDPPPRAWLRSAGPILEFGAYGSGRNLWAARLDEVVRLADRKLVFVAHGVIGFAVAWWARLSPEAYVERVAGAVFVRPLAALARSSERRFAGPKTLLPFPSLLAEPAAGASALAHEWGSQLVRWPHNGDAGGLVAELTGAGAGARRRDAPVQRELPVISMLG